MPEVYVSTLYFTCPTSATPSPSLGLRRALRRDCLRPKAALLAPIPPAPHSLRDGPSSFLAGQSAPIAPQNPQRQQTRGLHDLLAGYQNRHVTPGRADKPNKFLKFGGEYMDIS